MLMQPRAVLYVHNLKLYIRGFGKLDTITYKPGWGPWKFLPIYLTTYLAGTLAGYGVVSLSRAWYDRSQLCAFLPVARAAGGSYKLTDARCTHYAHAVHDMNHKFTHHHPVAAKLTRLLDWAFPGSAHGRRTGPRLWGSINVRDNWND